MTRPPKTPLKKVEGVCTPVQLVQLRHPALGDGAEGVLFKMPAYSEDEAVKGYVPYGFLWLAGVIISGNRFDGYLSRGKNPNERVNLVERGACLTPGVYYFHVGSQDTDKPQNYALLRGIQEWTIPKEQDIPEEFRRAVPWRNQDVDLTDGACIITGLNEEVQKAHLVPAKLHKWFLEQGFLDFALHRRITPGSETRDSSNIVRLFSPLHGQLDKFCWTPFPTPCSDDRQAWRLEAIWTVRNDVMANEYHGYQVRSGGTEISVQAVLARFAITIFAMLQETYFGLPVERLVIGDDGTEQPASYEDIQRWIKDNKINTDPKRRSQSQSPNKRSRTGSQWDSDEYDSQASEENDEGESWVSGESNVLQPSSSNSGACSPASKRSSHSSLVADYDGEREEGTNKTDLQEQIRQLQNQAVEKRGWRSSAGVRESVEADYNHDVVRQMKKRRKE